MSRRDRKECYFFSGVEYQGMYECTRYGNVCTGCDFSSDKWYERLWFDITVSIEMWYYCRFLYEIDRLKKYLFDRKYYDLFCKKYWWDRKKRYYDGIYYRVNGKSYLCKDGELVEKDIW